MTAADTALLADLESLPASGGKLEEWVVDRLIALVRDRDTNAINAEKRADDGLARIIKMEAEMVGLRQRCYDMKEALEFIAAPIDDEEALEEAMDKDAEGALLKVLDSIHARARKALGEVTP